MPLYEIVTHLGIFALLWSLRRRDWHEGKLFLVYLIHYGLERFFLAFPSSYRIIAFGLTRSQIIANLGFSVGLALLGWMPFKLNRQSI